MSDARFFPTDVSLTAGKLLEKLELPKVEFSIQKIFLGIADLSVASVHEAGFCLDKKHLAEAIKSQAGLVFIAQDIPGIPQDQRFVPVENAKLIFAKAAALFYPNLTQEVFVAGEFFVDKTAVVHPSACIGKGASIGAHAEIGPHVVIGQGVSIGAHTKIYSHVTITHALVGEHVTIHCGSRIGQEGFGFFMHEGKRVNVPHLGRVIIKDHVRIGANTTIDRGVLDDTKIGRGASIDNLVQIAHNVSLGDFCVVVAQTGIAGSTQLGQGSMLGGQVGVADHITIGQGVKVAAQSGLSRNVPDFEIVGGTPAVPIKDWHRQIFLLNKLLRKGKI